MRTWFNITNAASDEATIAIFDEIGMWGITAASFERELKAVSAGVINLEINSPGGSVFDGLAIYNMLRASGKTVNVKVMGVAASIASVIAMAGTKISMPANSMIMVHAPSGGVFGTATEMRDMAEVLDKVQASLIGVYMKRTGKTEDEISAMLAKDTWLSADEALALGFADEITDAVELTASFDVTDERLPEAARTAFKAAADARTAAEAAAEAARVEAERVAEEERVAAEALAAQATFAAQVGTLVKGTGFEAHAAAWAVKYAKPEEVTARITECREIKALFELAEMGDKVVAVLAAGKSLADARVELQNALAEKDKHIDTSRVEKPVAKAPKFIDVYAKRAGAIENSEQPTNRGPSAVSTAAIWAKRNK